MDDTPLVDGLAIVPAEVFPLDSTPMLELRPTAETGGEPPVGYVARGLTAELAEIVLAIAAVAWRPRRRGRKPAPPPDQTM